MGKESILSVASLSVSSPDGALVGCSSVWVGPALLRPGDGTARRAGLDFDCDERPFFAMMAFLPSAGVLN